MEEKEKGKLVRLFKNEIKYVWAIIKDLHPHY